MQKMVLHQICIVQPDKKCTTDTSEAEPFLFESDHQHWLNCSISCNLIISIPTYGGRIIYYVIDAMALLLHLH